MESRQKIPVSLLIPYLLLLVVCPLGMAGGCLLQKLSLGEMICNVVISECGTAVVVFCCLDARLKRKLDYNNQEFGKRFLVTYYCSFVIAILFSFIPPEGWPYLVIFIILAFFSNTTNGIVAGAVLLTTTVCLTPEADYRIFVLYFLSGVIGCVLFAGRDSSFHVVLPAFTSLLYYFLLLVANSVLFVNQKLSFTIFLIPIVNLFISFAFLMIVLSFFNSKVVNQYQEKYAVLDDQEHPLLISLKEEHREEYMNAVHRVYFSERIARKVGCNVDLVKSAAYYYRIGILKGERNWENTELICEENGFPIDSRELLKECILDRKQPRSKEAAIVISTDMVVSTLVYLLKERKEGTKIDYKRVIMAVFEKKIEQGMLEQCDISMKEYQLLKQTFLEENLYYDFLL